MAGDEPLPYGVATTVVAALRVGEPAGAAGWAGAAAGAGVAVGGGGAGAGVAVAAGAAGAGAV